MSGVNETDGDSIEQDDAGDTSRRTFLKAVGGSGAASMVGLGAIPSRASATAIGTGPSRLDEAFELRCDLADEYVGSASWPSHPDNGDEGRYSDRRGNYIKGLEPDGTGFGQADPAAYTSLTDALMSGDPADFTVIHTGGDRGLVSPQASHRFRMLGLDPHQAQMPAAPEFASDEMGAEMAEVYWQALVRDVPFVDYGSYSGTHTPSDAVQELNNFPAFTGPKQSGNVTLDTLFRMDVPGGLQGPYVSQFLLRDVPHGAITMEQKINEAADDDYVTEYGVWLDVLSGRIRHGGEFPPRTNTPKTGNQVYIRNGRDLGEYVHVNFGYQPYLDAALILFFGMEAPLDPAIPHTAGSTEEPYVTFGGFSITELIATVAGAAASAAWFEKWLVHRRLRPETYAGRIHNELRGNKSYGLPSNILNSTVVQRVNDVNQTERGHDTYLLPLAYPEGSPTHPSYPSGHAAIAGACVTALKALFDGTYTIQDTFEPNASGTALNSLSFTPTVSEELNKLAANISMGRDFAGVHYRSDAYDGLRVGEQVAHAVLEYVFYGANEPGKQLRYVDFDGNGRALY